MPTGISTNVKISTDDHSDSIKNKNSTDSIKTSQKDPLANNPNGRCDSVETSSKTGERELKYPVRGIQRIKSPAKSPIKDKSPIKSPTRNYTMGPIHEDKVYEGDTKCGDKGDHSPCKHRNAKDACPYVGKMMPENEAREDLINEMASAHVDDHTVDLSTTNSKNSQYQN